MGNHRTLWWIFQLATFEDTGRYLKIHNGQLGRLGEYLSDMLIPCSTGSSLCGIRQFFGPWEGHRNPCELTTIPSTWVSQYLIQLLTYVVAKNIYRLYIYKTTYTPMNIPLNHNVEWLYTCWVGTPRPSYYRAQRQRWKSAGRDTPGETWRARTTRQVDKWFYGAVNNFQSIPNCQSNE